MATPKGILRIKDGNAILYNLSNQINKVYYNGGKATRVDWFDESNESVQIQLNNGDVIIVNRACQIIKRINS